MIWDGGLTRLSALLDLVGCYMGVQFIMMH